MTSHLREWFSVYTKLRQEQTALHNLVNQGFECYLPMTVAPRKARGATAKERQEPLFPRYLFLNAAPEQQSLAPVRSTRGVVGLIRAGSELIRIPAAIIAELKARAHPASGLIALDSSALNSGDRVKIFDGPFTALEGVFKELRGANRSLLLLEILGRETAVEIDARFLQPAN